MFLSRSCSRLIRSSATKWTNPQKSPQQMTTTLSEVFTAGQRSSFHTTQVVNSTSFNVQDEEDFSERVLQSTVPVVADFHAEWCGPCKLLGPRIESEVGKHGGKVLLAKVDIDDMPELAMKYKINVVPSVLLFKGGAEVDRFQGNVDDGMLEHFVADKI